MNRSIMVSSKRKSEKKLRYVKIYVGMSGMQINCINATTGGYEDERRA